MSKFFSRACPHLFVVFFFGFVVYCFAGDALRPAPEETPRVEMGCGGFEEPPKEEPEPKDKSIDPLSLVPSDGAAFVHVRFREVWNGKAFADLRNFLEPVQKEWATLFGFRLGIEVDRLDTLTLILPDGDAVNTPRPTGHPEGMSGLIAIGFDKPVDRDRVERAFTRQGRRKSYKGKTYFFDETRWAGLYPVTDRLLVYGSEDAVVRFLDRKPDDGKGALTEALREARRGPSIVLGADPAKLSAKGEQKQGLLDSRYFTLGVEWDERLVARAKFVFGDTASAVEGEKELRTGIAFVRSMLEPVETEMEAPGVRNLTLEEALLRVGVSAFQRHADKILASIPVQREKNELRASLEVPAGVRLPRVLATGFAQRTLLGRDAEPTFDFVSSQVGTTSQTDPKLVKIHRALEAYHKDHGKYPDPMVQDAKGRPLYSWRVTLLPYLGEKELYEQFDRSQPWDSLRNKRLLDKIPGVYAESSSDVERWRTAFALPLTKGGVFEGSKGHRKADIRDGLARTMLFLRLDGWSVHWTKPMDFDLDHRDLENRYNVEGFGFDYRAVGAFGDGKEYPLWRRSAKELRALATRAGGEAVKPFVEPKSEFPGLRIGEESK